MTAAVTLLKRFRIHLSLVNSFSGSVQPISLPSMFIRIKRAAFQILFAKLREAATFSSEKRMSFPGLLPVTSVKRSASAPYSAIISSGSTPLPSDFDIFLPCASRIRP